MTISQPTVRRPGRDDEMSCPVCRGPATLHLTWYLSCTLEPIAYNIWACDSCGWRGMASPRKKGGAR